MLCFQMELDRSADPPPAIWVATTKSTVNKWVSEPLYTWQRIITCGLLSQTCHIAVANAQYEPDSQHALDSGKNLEASMNAGVNLRVV